MYLLTLVRPVICSGLGFSVMESLCDKVKVRSQRGRGTVVTLEKYIHKEEEATAS
jgi:anti-sigma regulatory factor (Ser/Thr protein kinase)